MTALAELQRAMRDALHAEDKDKLLARLAEGGPRSPLDQLSVYEGMYFSRQIEALTQDFPAVLARLGEELFARVAVTHVLRRPSQEPSLAFLGRELDGTLAALGLDDEAAIATLEGARNEAFWAPDCPSLTPAELGALGNDLGSAILSFHPSVRLLVMPVWARQAVDGEAACGLDPARPEQVTESVAVWRTGNIVMHDVVSPTEARALGLALGGASVASFFEVFLECREPEAEALGALLRWATRGWVCGAAGGRSSEGGKAAEAGRGRG